MLAVLLFMICIAIWMHLQLPKKPKQTCASKDDT